MIASLCPCIPAHHEIFQHQGKSNILLNWKVNGLNERRQLTAALARALASKSTADKPEEFRSSSARDLKIGIKLHATKKGKF